MFTLYEYGLIKNNSEMHKYVRNHTTDNINSLVEDLCSEIFENVISTTNANPGYDIFLGAFIKK